jgi:DNA adenine methylase
MSQLVAPFPYFGGKRAVASIVWERFGDVPNYVEPFFGSGAVLLGRPTDPKTETVNDLDGLLCNFWRAVTANPPEVARHADWPVSEADLSARHAHLVTIRASLTGRLQADPEYYDVVAAGWWVWGACAWIGGGWCSGDGPWVREGDVLVRRDQGRGINRQLPHVGDQGQGINRKLPHVGDQGRGIEVWFARLADRLRRVRIACGSWERVLGDSVTWRHGVTGVFLDPPYTNGEVEYSAADRGTVAADVAEWAREAGKRDDMRIALCGHDGEHDMPGWTVVPWKARGGYGNQGGDDEDDNRHREVIWFSPACGSAGGQRSLFGGGA